MEVWGEETAAQDQLGSGLECGEGLELTALCLI